MVRRWTVYLLILAVCIGALGGRGMMSNPGARHVHYESARPGRFSPWPDELQALQRWFLQRQRDVRQHSLFRAHVTQEAVDAAHRHDTLEVHSHRWNDASVVALDDAGDDKARGESGGGSVFEPPLGTSAGLLPPLRSDLSQQPPPAGAAPPVARWVAESMERPPDA